MVLYERLVLRVWIVMRGFLQMYQGFLQMKYVQMIGDDLFGQILLLSGVMECSGCWGIFRRMLTSNFKMFIWLIYLRL